jgi:hypothetical protein
MEPLLDLCRARVCTQVTFAYRISIPVTYYIALATSQFSTQEMSARGKLTGSAPSRASSVIRSFLNFIYFRHAATVIVPLPSVVHQRSSHPSANTPRSVERRFVILCFALQIIANSGQWGPIFVFPMWVILKYDVVSCRISLSCVRGSVVISGHRELSWNKQLQLHLMKGTSWCINYFLLFWDITPCSSLSANRRFGGIYCLHLQGRKISWLINQRETTHFLLLVLLLYL